MVHLYLILNHSNTIPQIPFINSNFEWYSIDDFKYVIHLMKIEVKPKIFQIFMNGNTQLMNGIDNFGYVIYCYLLGIGFFNAWY